MNPICQACSQPMCQEISCYADEDGKQEWEEIWYCPDCDKVRDDQNCDLCGAICKDGGCTDPTCESHKLP